MFGSDIRFYGATGGFCSESEIRCTSSLGYRKREVWPVWQTLIDGKDVGSEVVFISRDCVCFEGGAWVFSHVKANAEERKDNAEEAEEKQNFLLEEICN